MGVKKILSKIGKSHNGPDNKANGNGNNGTSKEILENLSGSNALAGVIGGVIGGKPRIFKGSQEMDDPTTENVGNPEGTGPKPMHKSNYPQDLGPDADEGSPDTGDWDEDNYGYSRN
tara:strand:- start:1973 stop:2323 length:351 start_codon:yes stop_codon:yes gene_type:complete